MTNATGPASNGTARDEKGRSVSDAATTTREVATRGGWSRTSIALHWLAAVLIAAQVVNHDAMVAFWHAVQNGAAVSGATELVARSHIVAGAAILVVAALRLAGRLAHGRPAYPDNDPAWATWLAKATHLLLYAILLAMPVLGLAAWLTESQTIAGLHTALWIPLVALIGLHVAGALMQHFVFRTDVLRRMLPFARLRRRRA